jgi:hypothetical protein
LQPLAIPVEAIDMSIFDERLFLVLAANGIVPIPLRDLELSPIQQDLTDRDNRRSVEMSRRTQIEDYTPATWEHSESLQGMHPVS